MKPQHQDGVEFAQRQRLQAQIDELKRKDDMSELYNHLAIDRIRDMYPDAAKGLVALIDAAEKSGAGSAEVKLRYDKPTDRDLGKYEVMLVMRVQERSEP